MSNPFSALDFSDDENITVVKPAEAKGGDKKAHVPVPHKPHEPRKVLQQQEEDIKQKSKKQVAGARGFQQQPDVPHPGERSKIGLKKEAHVDTHKQPAEGERRGRQFDRRSGTGRGKEVKKGGAGGRNWGKPGDEAPAPAATPDAAGEAGAEKEAEEAAPAPVEEDPELTLDEYEKLKAQKRQGEAFQEKEVRKVTAPIEGKVYKKDDEAGEGVYIQLGSDDHELKKKPGHFKSKAKQVVDINFNFRAPGASSSEGPARRGRPEGGRGGFRGGDREARPERSSEPRGEGRGERRGGDRPRGGAPGGRGGRGGAAAPSGNQARIDTADQSAFPKLGSA